jgi:hypothetical protein
MNNLSSCNIMKDGYRSGFIKYDLTEEEEIILHKVPDYGKLSIWVARYII